MYRRCIMGERKNTSLDKDSPEVNRRLTVKYTKEERLDIGRRIYDGEISRYQAAEIYDISEQTARDYMRLYRDVEQLPPKRVAKDSIKVPSLQTDPARMEELESMIPQVLDQVQQGLFDKAKENLDSHIFAASSVEEAKALQEEHGGFIKTMWCGDLACEEKMKEEAGMSSRCIPFDQENLGDTCPCCGKPAKHMIYWGIAY